MPDANAALRHDMQIDVPNLAPHQLAYNSGMARYRGKNLVALRIDDLETSGQGTTQHIAMLELGAHFRPRGTYTWLKAQPEANGISTDEDPRLVVVEDTLYIVYNLKRGPARRMQVGRIELGEDLQGNTTFALRQDKELQFTTGDVATSWEKNWTPFAYQNTLHLVYRTNPPMVLRLTAQQLDTDDTAVVPQIVSTSTRRVPWNFGEMRGGTQAIFEPLLQQYVSFFHSSCTAMGPQGLARYYCKGFYTFAAQPPFDIDRMCMAPLVGANFYDDVVPLQPLNQSVIFPQGLVDDGDVWHVAYGKNDSTLHLATWDKTELLRQCRPTLALATIPPHADTDDDAAQAQGVKSA